MVPEKEGKRLGLEAGYVLCVVGRRELVEEAGNPELLLRQRQVGSERDVVAHAVVPVRAAVAEPLSAQELLLDAVVHDRDVEAAAVALVEEELEVTCRDRPVVVRVVRASAARVDKGPLVRERLERDHAVCVVVNVSPAEPGRVVAGPIVVLERRLAHQEGEDRGRLIGAEATPPELACARVVVHAVRDLPDEQELACMRVVLDMA